MKLKNTKLKNILVFYAVIISLIPLLIISFIVLQVFSANLELELHNKNLQIASLFASEIANNLQEPVQNLKELESLLINKRIKETEINEHLTDLVNFHNYFEEIQILDLSGKIIYCNSAYIQNVGLDMSNAYYFNQVKTSDSIHWSSVFINLGTDRPTLACSFKSSDFIVVGFLNLSQLGKDIKNIEVSDKTIVAVVDEKGLFVAHSDTIKVVQRQFEKKLKLFKNESRENQLIKEVYNNEEMHISIAPVPINNWYVLIYQPVSEVFASVNKVKQVFYLGIIISLILSVIAAFILHRIIISPVVKLIQQTKLIADGNYDKASPIESYFEINQLTNHFLSMSESINTREISIRENEIKLLEAQKIGHLGYWELNLETNKIKWSEEVYKLFGLEPFSVEPTLEYLYGRISQQDMESITIKNLNNIKNGIPFTSEFRLFSPDGTYKYITAIFNYSKNNEGKINKVIGTLQDVTQIKEITNALKVSEERLRLAMDAANEGMWELSLADRQAFFSPRFYEMLGFDKHISFSNMDEIFKIVHPDDYQKVTLTFDGVFAKEKKEIDIEFRIRNNAGVYRWMQNKGKLIIDMNNHEHLRFIGTFTDITTRKHFEEEVIKSEKKFRTLVQSIDDIVYTLNKEQRILSIYGQSLLRNGISPSHFLGKRPEDIYESDVAAVHIAANKKALKGEFVVYESTYNNNGVIEHYLTSVSPIFGKTEDEVIGLVGISKNITFRKSMENELEERVKIRTAQLEEANKELEAFSYTVSHDLRTPIRAIEGFSKIIINDYSNTFNEEVTQLFNDVVENTDKMGKLIDSLLSFSRLGRKELNKSDIDMNDLINKIVNEIKNDPKNGKINFNIPKLPDVYGDVSLIKQVVINLLSNAVKYSSKKLFPVISISGTIEKNNTVFCISDNGTGFNMKYSDKLFGVFQRLHSNEDFEGNGVGLAIVHRIIQKHGGKVWADSVLNEGSHFYFSIPLKNE